MSRSRSLSLLLLSLLLCASGAIAQARKPAAAVRSPSAKDSSITVNAFMKDDKQNELLLATRLWPDHPDYNAVALQRYFALMKALGPAYKQDDNVAYTWSAKGRVAKCAIYLEAFEAGVKTGTGALVGCEANGVSSIAVPSAGDPKLGASPSQDPRHLNDVLEMFRKQSERARANLPKP